MTPTAFLIGAVLAFTAARVPADTTTIIIAATTDVHGRAMAWDYERDRPAPLGLVRAATVVDSLRRAHPGQVVLVDAGDLLQGNPFATYWARHAAPVHPIVDALNRMHYDAATPGNHEFNFGLDVVQRALGGARYAVVSANILNEQTGAPLFTPSVMIERMGVKIGIVGATTPGVLVWDGPNVRGRVTLRGVAEAVPPEVRRLRTAGADVVLLVVHAGLGGPSSYATNVAPPENDVAAAIAQSWGDLDVTVIGHTHSEIADSMIGSTLVVQPKNWARSVAVVELSMVRDGAHWRVARKHGTIVPLANVVPQAALVDALTAAHEAARTWANGPVGRSADAMPMARARLEDTPVLDFVNGVMRARSGADLSATAAFNTDGAIPQGNVSRADLASVYPYDNTLRAVRVTGTQLREYLEFSARYYRGMDERGPVVNDSVRGYNFDILSGADYELDLSQPVGHRVSQLMVNGHDVRPDQSFVLALNNYRAQGGGGFAMLAGAPVVYDRNEDIRELLADEVTRRGTIHAADYFVPNWRIRGVARQSDSILLRVFATNDVHGALDSRVAAWSNGRPVGGVANIAGMMNRLAAECHCATIRLDGGDIMQGSAASNLTHGRAMVEAFNAMHVDAAAIGNHEFDWSVDTLAARIREAHFGWLSANIRETGTRRRPAWTTPMKIVQAGSRRVAVVGYTTPGTTTSTNPDNVRRLGFQGASTLDSAIASARALRPDFVIVVAHEGAFCNNQNVCQGEIVELAQALHNKPDLIVSGHTHSLVTTVVNGIPIVQARSSGTALGIVDFVAQDSGRVARLRVETVWADRERPDSAVAAVVARYNDQVRAVTERNIATLGQDLTRRGDQYPLGDMVADALRESAHADIAFINNTGLRSDLLAGPVSWGQLYEVLPFGNFVVSMPVTGAVLKQALEHALAASDTRVSVSGMSVRVNRDQPPGQRVAAISLADGRQVLDDSVYQLATFDFLAAGGSGYSMLRNRPFINTGTDELDAFIAWLRRQPQPVRAATPFAPRISDR